MKNNMAFFRKADQERSRREWTVAVTASVLLHIGLALMLVVFSGHARSTPSPVRVIDVDLSMAPPPKGKAPAPPAKTVAPKKKQAVKKASRPVTKKKDVVGLKKKKTVKKTKKKIIKPKDTIDDAIKRLEKDLAKTPKPKKDPIAERLKKMAEETDREPAKNDEPVGTEKGTADKGDSAVEATLELRYKHNVGMEIRENWAFSDKLAAGREDLETWVVFEVLPDGDIRGVTITRRSGNDYMDSSATMAIVKSSPVRPFPPGLNKPFVEVRLKFTPKGLN